MTDITHNNINLSLSKDSQKYDKENYCQLFELPFFKSMMQYLTNNEHKHFKEILYSFVESETKLCDTTDKQLKVINTGVRFLSLFIQKNWTGPDFPVNESLGQILSYQDRESVIQQLVVDGENVVKVLELPELLFISKVILEVCWNTFKNSEEAKIWYLRCLFIHQQILEELSSELHEKINIVINEILTFIKSISNSTAVAYYLEFSRIFMYYGNIQKSKVNVKNATELSNMEIFLSGALGKRTKFQNDNLAQLVVKINVNNEDLEVNTSDIPASTSLKDIKLEDDVRLDKIKYTDDSHNKCPTLTGLQQAVALSNLFQTQKSQPKDSLADEELQPLINNILDQPRAWSMRMTTLLLRSKLEANHKRTVERSMMQVQVLADSIKDSDVPFKERFSYFFVSHLPPKWDIQSTLANILASMGSIKSALEIYRNLEEWENVIYCYNTLQLRHKAQEIIEQELKKDPSPKLWCLLGDATDDVSCYEKAWILSNKKSARSQRHWALFYYYRKNYAESIGHFQKSLEINSLQGELWYRLGYAALMEENWETSALAYRRYCVLDPECFEAWNNLARCYCELKQKQRAWRALQEALKVDYSKWKVWDNYMVVSSDLKMFDEVIKSYHEILNLKEKHLDIPVLHSLVMGYKSLQDNQEKESAKVEYIKNLKSKLLELFGRLTSQIINDPELWFLYSEVVDVDSPENLTKKYQLLLKSHRSAMNKVDWEKKLESCNNITHVLSKLIEVGLRIQKPDVLMSCEMATKSALAKIKKEYPDVNISEDLEKNLEKLMALTH